MSDLSDKTSAIFEKFTERLAKVNLRTAASVVATVGVGVFFSGVAQEINGHLHLLQTGGQMALDTYNQALQSGAAHNLGDWLKDGMLGKLPSFGGSTEARGLLLATAGPTLTAAAVSLARGFVNMKSTITDSAEKLSGMAATLTDDISKRLNAVASVGKVTEKALAASLEKAKQALWGGDRTFVPPDFERGQYAGKVLGETAHHVLVSVDGRANTATALEKERLNGIKFSGADILKVKFSNGLAVAPTLTNGLSRAR